MAYWRLRNTDNAARWLSSAPATLRDLYAILKTSKGKPPRELFGKPKQDPRVLQHWSRTTKSSPKAISWWTG